MILVIAILASLSAVFLLFRFTRRHDPEQLVQPGYLLEPPPDARPLFEPTASELKSEEDLQTARLIAAREYKAKAVNRAEVDRSLTIWRSRPDAARSGDLLRVTAEKGLEGDFTRAACEIIEKFNETGINGLTNDDLAALLDSHLRLLSERERSSGDAFWLRQEINRLRADKDVDLQ